MTRSGPPRLALAVLCRFVPDNEPLVGDLVEGFAVRRSRSWFWRQVLLAVVLRGVARRDQHTPLQLAGHAAFMRDPRAQGLAPARPLTLAASPHPAVGGLGLVALGVLVAVVRPHAWWIVLPALLGGAAIGAAMVIARRRGVLSAGTGSVLREPRDVTRR